MLPGAAVVIESVSAERADRAEERETTFPDGARAHYRPTFDRRTGILSDEQTIRLPDRSTGTFRYSVRAYDPGELIALLTEAGFVCAAPFGSTDGSPQTPRDANVVVARSRDVVD